MDITSRNLFTHCMWWFDGCDGGLTGGRTGATVANVHRMASRKPSKSGAGWSA
ncbi:hypothetical protein [uncultured Endozoicomonas sp.]|uniref:hypothetical protein n=1 Tax=uncultured Endozoicomonas sp. TaxID=432652 RepID=UPI00262B8D72|nr:hypothetical protein [uncultured Endozoicomonas sp.]